MNRRLKVTCPACGAVYDDTERWTLCPHTLRPTMPSLECAGTARPAQPTSVFAEDCTLLILARRMRIKRSHIRVLN